MSAFAILATGILAGACLRLTYLRLPLDWDHGLLLYQSYWYERIRKFIVTICEIEPEVSLSKITRPFGETDMVRTQSLAHSFIFIILHRMCRDRVWAYRLFDLFYYTLTALVLFGLGTLVFDPVSAAIGATLFSVFSCMPFFWVAMDNTEKFQVLFTYAGMLCLALFLKTPLPILPVTAGVCFFLSMLFKQNVGFVILASLVFMIMRAALVGAALAIAAMFVCYGILFIYYAFKGHSLGAIFSRFFISINALFYLFELKVDKEGKVTTPQNYNLVARIRPNLVKLLSESSLIWAMSGAWFVFMALTDIGSPRLHLFGLLALGTALAFFAANKFFPYYYIPFLPLLALTSGDFLHRMYAEHSLFSATGMLLTASSMVLFVLNFRKTWRFFFRSTPFEQGAHMYSNTLYNFGVSEEIGRHIRENTSPDDYIYVYNLNPEIYFFAQRRCPTNALYIDNLSTAAYTPEDQERAEKTIKDKLKAASPAYIVISKTTNVPISFFEGVTGNRYFLEKEYHAGFDAVQAPVILQMFKVRRISESMKHVEAGEELFGQDRITEAMDDFHKALALDPMNGDALNNLGVCHHRLGEPLKAVDHFIQALQADPSNRDVVLNLLDMDMAPKDKLTVLQLYLAFNPDDAEMRKASRDLSGA